MAFPAESPPSSILSNLRPFYRVFNGGSAVALRLLLFDTHASSHFNDQPSKQGKAYIGKRWGTLHRSPNFFGQTEFDDEYFLRKYACAHHEI